MHLSRIKWVAFLAPVVGLTAFEVFRHVVLHPALGETRPHVAEHVFSAIFLIAAVLTFTFAIFRLLERLQGQLLALNEAAIAVSSDLTLEGVLSRVAELAREVAAAPYASVLIEGPHPVEMTSGQAPVPGVDLSLPILARGRQLGEMRLTNPEGTAFRPADRQALTIFATQAGVAIENARLFERVEELVRTRERERIGMDLHDGVVQELYGLGLKIEDAAGMLTDRPEEAGRLLFDARSGVRSIIGEVRTYVYDLRDGDRSVDLGSALGRVAQEFASAPLDVAVELDSEILLPGGVAAHVVHVAREAVANAAQHASASRVLLRAGRNGNELIIEIRDDGSGFDPRTDGAGLGLKDMRDRASWCGGTLEVRSEIDIGTTVRLTLPSAPDREAVG